MNVFKGAIMYISAYVKNIEEGVRFCARYGITCSVVDGELVVKNPSVEYYKQFAAMEEALRKKSHLYPDHPNSYISDKGVFILTISPYDGELTEEDQKKLRRKGYDIRESGFDLYGSGTTTYVMAELVSPLDEGGVESPEM